MSVPRIVLHTFLFLKSADQLDGGIVKCAPYLYASEGHFRQKIWKQKQTSSKVKAAGNLLGERGGAARRLGESAVSEQDGREISFLLFL